MPASDPKTVGWRPTCKHEAEPLPAIVLDPFCGSGTTGAVARDLGRRFIGLDLSANYLGLLALPRAERKQIEAALNDLPLFSVK
jgi:adenine specific DNA methylase Mod